MRTPFLNYAPLLALLFSISASAHAAPVPVSGLSELGAQMTPSSRVSEAVEPTAPPIRTEIASVIPTGALQGLKDQAQTISDEEWVLSAKPE